MKVLHLSTYDTKGGGAISTYRLHHGLLNLGVDSKMFVAQKQTSEKEIISYRWPSDRWNRLKRNWRARKIKNSYLNYRPTIPTGYEIFNHLRTPNLNLVDQIPDADIINLHWVAGFVDARDLFTQVKDKPILWRLSDQNPLTGGCHYDAECGKFLTGCGACPQLGSSQKMDLSYRIWQEKKQLYDRVDPRQFQFIAQSNWMADLVKRSDIFKKFDVTVIPNGLDINVFKPRDSNVARELFNIPKDKTVILFVSDSITNKRKGLSFLIEALKEFENNEDILLCAIGNNKIENAPKNFIHLGSISDIRLLSLAYAMADLHIIPSIQDNLANTVIESLCCGTPVIGFPIGGNLDMIDDGTNGILCDEVSTKALRQSIDSFLSNQTKFDSASISNAAVKKYDYKVQATKVKALYDNTLASFYKSRE